MDATSYLLGKKAGGGSGTETDPIFSASASAGITSEDITSWNNKSDFSGNYNDLTNKPTDLLHYKGHVNSFESLPPEGQTSETPLSTINTLNHPLLDGINNGVLQVEYYDNYRLSVFLDYYQTGKLTYGNYFVVLTNYFNSNAHYNIARGFMTDYPEQLYFYTENTGVVGDTSKNSKFVIGAKYDADKPVYMVVLGNESSYPPTYTLISQDTEIDRPTDGQESSSETDYYRGFDIANVRDSSTRMRLYLNTSIKWKKPNTSLSQTINGETFIYSGNTYAFKGNENYNPIPVLSTPSQVITGNFYTVGDNNDIYYANSQKKWEEWSKTGLTSISGYDATKTQVLKNVEGTLTWVDET